MESSHRRDVGTHTRSKLVTRIVLCGGYGTLWHSEWRRNTKEQSVNYQHGNVRFFRVMWACQCCTKYSDGNRIKRNPPTRAEDWPLQIS